MDDTDFSNGVEPKLTISTSDVQAELSRREGVSTLVVEPYQSYSVTVGGETISGTGPAVISINRD